jgi:RimJ/RimL family protein N-acetyltransferase
MDISFTLADKGDLPPILLQLFPILRGNMTAIAPTGDSYEEDLRVWREYILPALAEPSRQLVLMRRDGVLAGYFQYSLHGGTLVMEEIQISPEHQGTGLFRSLYQWLAKTLPPSLTQVEAYAHKSNRKSQAILEHLGLEKAGENPSGSSWHYLGSCQTLWERVL